MSVKWKALHFDADEATLKLMLILNLLRCFVESPFPSYLRIFYGTKWLEIWKFLNSCKNGRWSSSSNSKDLHGPSESSSLA